MSNWISVKDRLPEDGSFDEDGYVLVWVKWRCPAIARKDWAQGWKPEHWRTDCGERLEIKDVTHWMPLPEPPKE
jgi:hypothetical protein